MLNWGNTEDYLNNSHQKRSTRQDGSSCPSTDVAALEKEDRRLMQSVRRRLLYTSLQNFAGRTSAHGFHLFMAQQIPWIKFIWTVVVLCASAGLLLHTYSQIDLFLSYPVSSTTRLLTNQFVFPDLTLCDPLMKRFFIKDSREIRASDPRLSNYFSLNFILGHNFVPKMDQYSGNIKATKIAYTSFEHAVHTWPLFNMSMLSARMLDMLIFCQFDEDECFTSNFSVFYHRDYGNCFTFRPQVRTLRTSGVEKGLILILYVPSVDRIQTNDYYSDTMTTGLESGGLRVVVHPKNTIPYPSEYGINSPEGMQTVLALSQVTTRLANTPTAPCDPKGRFQTHDHILGHTRTYEKQLTDCTHFEHIRSVERQCGCTIDGPVEYNSSGKSKSKRQYCHDLLGSQNKTKLLKIIDDIQDFLLANATFAQEHSFSITRKSFTSQLLNTSLFSKRVELANILADKFPLIAQTKKQLQCALPFFDIGSKESDCLNICQYDSYDFSVFQSRWPDPDFAIRGSRMRLARISKILIQRILQVQSELPRHPSYNLTTNYALNHSLVYRGIKLEKCVEQYYNRSSSRFINDTVCLSVHQFIRQSFLQLRVYPKTLTVRQLLEERSYELVNLFSDLGGILGLWIGVSVVTLCEFVEITLIVLSYYSRAAVRKVQLVFSKREAKSRPTGVKKVARIPDEMFYPRLVPFSDPGEPDCQCQSPPNGGSNYLGKPDCSPLLPVSPSQSLRQPFSTNSSSSPRSFFLQRASDKLTSVAALRVDKETQL